MTNEKKESAYSYDLRSFIKPANAEGNAESHLTLESGYGFDKLIIPEGRASSPTILFNAEPTHKEQGLQNTVEASSEIVAGTTWEKSIDPAILEWARSPFFPRERKAPDQKERNRQAMEAAMAIRTEDGCEIPILSEGESVNVLIPHVGLDENGLYSPINFADDFSNGNVPDNMTIEHGTLTGVRDASGKVVEKVNFDNPVLNLPIEDQQALKLGKKLIADCKTSGVPASTIGEACKAFSGQPVGETKANPQKISKEAKVQPDKQASEAEEEEWGSGSGMMEVFERAGKGLYARSRKGVVQLANFSIHALEMRIIYGVNSTEATTVAYVLEITSVRRTMQIEVCPNDMDNVVRLVQKHLPECIVNPEFNKGHAIVANYVREQLVDIQAKVIIRRTGFQRVAGYLVYVHDGAQSPSEDTVFETGKTILDNPNVSDAQALHEAFAFLNMCPRDELMIPVWLYAHLGPCFQLFELAGYTPRFLLIVAGHSGSLKTSMSLPLFRIFADQSLTPEASFKDTPTSLEVRMGELNGRVLVIDDFRPPVTDRYSKGTVELLESVVRFVGDNISKGRSNARLGKNKEFKPSGSVLVTAEDLSGSYSSLLRCLVLPIERNDIDGNQLRRYQDNPYYMATHMNRFLRWAGHNGDSIIRMIRENFDTERAFFRTVVRELRLIDTGVTLMLMAQIICCYARECGAMNSEEVERLSQRCRNAIRDAVAASEARSREADPVALYINALVSMMDSGEISVASSQATYSGANHDGFYKNGELWLKPQETYGKIRRYYQRLDQVFPLSEDQTKHHLEASEILKVYLENDGGKAKKLYSHRTTVPGRPRMMVLYTSKIESYRENEMS